MNEHINYLYLVLGIFAVLIGSGLLFMLLTCIFLTFAIVVFQIWLWAKACVRKICFGKEQTVSGNEEGVS